MIKCNPRLQVNKGFLLIYKKSFAYNWFLMITEEDKHLAGILEICGFGLMSPLGKLVLDLPDTEWADLKTKFLIIFLFYSLLFYLGIILLAKSVEKVEERKSNKWEKNQ